MEVIHSDTTAHIGTGAQINKDSSGESGNQSVTVTAVNDVKSFTFGGGLGAGIGGIGGGIDVGVVRNNVTSWIGDSADVEAQNNVAVNALCPGMVQTTLNRSVWEAWNRQQPSEKRQSYEEWAAEKIRRVVPLGR